MAIRVLFLCTGNSARSQMAEGLLRARGGERFAVFSAGSEPAAAVHPMAIAAMDEVGVSIGDGVPKHLSNFLEDPWDYVITVCDRARDACPVFPGDAARIHWGFDDPAAAVGTDEQRMRAFRRVRDEIGQRLRLFLPVAQVRREGAGR
ncbi:MAG: arsenate reductase ArsC [Chloroflexi bacterium]|nr:arsenate reductase ArsC [Chloroflexota bacterium]